MRAVLDKQAVAYGMGMGVNKRTFDGARYLLNNYTGKLLLDADALNSIAQFGDIPTLFKDKRCQVVVTPHVKEFSRLTNLSIDEILNGSVSTAKRFAFEKDVTVLLKGASTIITDGIKTVLTDTGCSAQAKGGSGDVLAGLIGGLCATGLSTFDGGVVGAYIAGLAAQIASEKYSGYSALPTDYIQEIGVAFKRVIE
jgi:NAD(P)H-hydrate epimerase